VVIDDLDRLEPAQAVEVLRMVRSVADFSRFRYVMCYDRDVLAHAVETALQVQNGALYLQKIIPLSFSLPRPENFALRSEFYRGALTIWQEVS
ncbi:pilA-like protein, partial [Pseudomonas donghuensis]|nr:pilA-like protein [Pseudomonas donghuensis]